MEFQQLVRKRRMIRNFEARPLPPGAVERILDNARRGPSAGFSQGFEFLVFDGPEQTARYWEATDPDRYWEQSGWPGVYHAPLLIVPLAHKAAYLARYSEPDKPAWLADEGGWPVPYWYVDTGMAALLVLQTAVDLDLGALFFGMPDHAGIAAFRAAFDVPEAYEPIGVVAVGHAASDRPSGSLKRGHRPAADIVHRGRW